MKLDQLTVAAARKVLELAAWYCDVQEQPHDPVFALVQGAMQSPGPRGGYRAAYAVMRRLQLQAGRAQFLRAAAWCRHVALPAEIET